MWREGELKQVTCTEKQAVEKPDLKPQKFNAGLAEKTLRRRLDMLHNMHDMGVPRIIIAEVAWGTFTIAKRLSDYREGRSTSGARFWLRTWRWRFTMGPWCQFTVRFWHFWQRFVMRRTEDEIFDIVWKDIAVEKSSTLVKSD